MISDTLYEALVDIRAYLDDDILGRAYEGDTRRRIEALVTEMQTIRELLDAVPDGPRLGRN